MLDVKFNLFQWDSVPEVHQGGFAGTEVVDVGHIHAEKPVSARQASHYTFQTPAQKCLPASGTDMVAHRWVTGDPDRLDLRMLFDHVNVEMLRVVVEGIAVRAEDPAISAPGDESAKPVQQSRHWRDEHEEQSFHATGAHSLC